MQKSHPAGINPLEQTAWFFYENGQISGPTTIDQLVGLKGGERSGSQPILVSRIGFEKWYNLSDFIELFSATRTSENEIAEELEQLSAAVTRNLSRLAQFSPLASTHLRSDRIASKTAKPQPIFAREPVKRDHIDRHSHTESSLREAAAEPTISTVANGSKLPPFPTTHLSEPPYLAPQTIAFEAGQQDAQHSLGTGIHPQPNARNLLTPAHHKGARL